MGGSKSSTHVETRYQQRPLSQEEKDLIRAQADLARKLGLYSETAAERSQEQYDLWKQTYLPLEKRFLTKVEETNQKLWKPNEQLLNRIQSTAASASQKGLKNAQDKVAQLLANRGLTGSGIEAKALMGLSAEAMKAYQGAINDAFWKALQQSNVIRQQQLQNLGAAINVGRSGFTGSLQYQGLAGQQAQGAIGGYASAFQSWDSTWKAITTQHSTSRGASPLWEVAGVGLGLLV